MQGVIDRIYGNNDQIKLIKKTINITIIQIIYTIIMLQEEINTRYVKEIYYIGTIVLIIAIILILLKIYQPARYIVAIMVALLLTILPIAEAIGFYEHDIAQLIMTMFITISIYSIMEIKKEMYYVGILLHIGAYYIIINGTPIEATLKEMNELRPRTIAVATGIVVIIIAYYTAITQRNKIETLEIEKQSKIEEMNNTNKQIVEQGEALKLIIESTGKAIIAVDKDCTIINEISDNCKTIFKENIVNRKLYDILYANNLDQKKEEFKRGVKIIASGKISKDTIPELMDTEIKLGEELLNIEYSNMNNEVVIIQVENITKRKREIEAIRMEREANERLIKVIKDKKGYIRMRREYERTIYKKEDMAIEEYIREIHTLKSNLGHYGLNRTMDIIHEIETKLIDGDNIDSIIEMAKQSYEEETNEIEKYFAGELIKDEYSIKVPRKVIDRLEIVDMREEIKNELKYYTMIELNEIYGGINDQAEIVASKLGKAMPKIVISNLNYSIDKGYAEMLETNIMHIINNMIYHGIESNRDREHAGKSRQGTIHIDAVEHKGNLLLRYIDDGKGLDYGKLYGIAVNKYKTKQVSLDDIKGVIFDDGVTTADKVGSIAGRGVGMAAVKHAVEGCGGKIIINSIRSVGTAITIVIPSGKYCAKIKATGEV